MRGPSRARAASAGRTALGACLVAALCGPAYAQNQTPPPAPPEAPELTLTWLAPVGCPSSLDLEAQFARLLGGPSRLPSGKHIDASALVRSSSPDRWSVELATIFERAQGRRTLAGDSCASVASAAVLILALMIDPAAAERALLAPPTRAPTSSASPPPPPTVVRAPAPPPAARPPLRVRARVFGGAVVALLPDVTPAAGLAVGVGYRRFGAELAFTATTDRRVSAAPDTAGDFDLLVGGARACGVLGGRAVVWQLCLGGELERVTGTGVGSPVRDTWTKTVLMGAGTGGLLVTLPLRARLGLSLDLDAAVRPYHPMFADAGAPIFRIPVVSGFAALGLVLTI